MARLLGFPVDDGGAPSPLRLALCLCPPGEEPCPGAVSFILLLCVGFIKMHFASHLYTE